MRVPGVTVGGVEREGVRAWSRSACSWAAYFSGTARFGALDPTQPATGDSGTALAVLPGGTFGLEGVRMGARCKSFMLQQVGNTLIHVIEIDC